MATSLAKRFGAPLLALAAVLLAVLAWILPLPLPTDPKLAPPFAGTEHTANLGTGVPDYPRHDWTLLLEPLASVRDPINQPAQVNTNTPPPEDIPDVRVIEAGHPEYAYIGQLTIRDQLSGLLRAGVYERFVLPGEVFSLRPGEPYRIEEVTPEHLLLVPEDGGQRMQILFSGAAPTIRPESDQDRNNSRRPRPGFGTGQGNPNRPARGNT